MGRAGTFSLRLYTALDDPLLSLLEHGLSVRNELDVPIVRLEHLSHASFDTQQVAEGGEVLHRLVVTVVVK